MESLSTKVTDLMAQSPVVVITTASWRDELERQLLIHLASGQGRGLQYATNRLTVVTLEELATNELTGKEACFNRPTLDSASLTQLAMSAVSAARADDLQAYRNDQTRAQVGFARQVGQTWLQFQLAGVQPAELAKQLTDQDQLLQQKLHDLGLFSANLDQETANYLTVPQMMAALADHAAMIMRGKALVVAGIKDLSAAEFRALQALKRAATTSEYFPLMNVTDQVPAGRGHLDQLFTGAPQTSAPALTPEVALLKKYFNNEVLEASADVSDARVMIAHALDPQLEADWVADQIHEMTHREEEPLRYRDIVIYLPRVGVYQPELTSALHRAGVPYWMTVSPNLRNQRLALFAQAVLADRGHRYDYENIMNLLQSEVLLPNAKAMDVVEKEVLTAYRQQVVYLGQYLYEQGLTSNDDWQRKWQLYDGKQSDYQRERTHRVNAIRQQVVEFFNDLDQATPGQLTDHIAKYCIRDNHELVRKDLQKQLGRDGETFQLALMTEAKKRFENTLHEAQKLAEVANWRQRLAGYFRAAFSEGMDVGPKRGLDQVRILPLNRQEFGHPKAVFLMGVTAQHYPGQLVDRGLLLNAEWERLQREVPAGKFLADSNRQRQQQLPNDFCRVLQAAGRVFMTYPVNATDGTLQHPAEYLGILKKDPHSDFLQIGLTTPLKAPGLATNPLINRLRDQFADGQQPRIKGPVALTAADKDQLANLADLVGFRNKTKDLTPALAQQLFVRPTEAGSAEPHIRASFSALEVYATNPAEYFFQYGLGIRKWELAGINGGSDGTYLHDLLEVAVTLLRERGQHLPELDASAVEKLARDAIKRVTDPSQDESRDNQKRRQIVAGLTKDLQSQWHKHLLDERFQKYLQWMAELKQDPIESELPFGKDDLPVQVGPVLLNGMIDRIDRVEGGGLRLVDYKTGSINATRKRVANTQVKYQYGLDLQLLIYAIAMKKMKEFDDDPVVELAFAPMTADGAWKLLTDPNLRDTNQIKAAVAQAKQQVETMGNRILAGKFPIDPYQLAAERGKETKWQSDYAPIIGFDERFGNQYRILGEEDDEK